MRLLTLTLFITIIPLTTHAQGVPGGASNNTYYNNSVTEYNTATGAMQLKGYGSGSKTGTQLYSLGVDAAGNVIEGASGGGGSGIQAVTTSQRDALSPSQGDVVYHIDENRLEWYDGSTWFFTGTASPAVVFASCNEILSNGSSVGDGVYTIDPGSGEFDVYCDMTGGGWMLIADGGSSCSSVTEKSTVNLSGSCGYLPFATVSALAASASSVRLRSGGSHTSYSTATSSSPLAVSALTTATGTWHNGASNTFSAWSWSVACGSSANGWPNMFHACGNGGGVHWLTSARFGRAGSPDSRSSAWLR